MISEALSAISEELKKLNIDYQFGRWQGKVVYPYFVGEASADEFISENNYQEGTCFINGFTRGAWLDLMNTSEKIKQCFADFRTITESGSGISITVAAFSVVPYEDAELKRIQITLNIKEWSVNNE